VIIYFDHLNEFIENIRKKFLKQLKGIKISYNSMKKEYFRLIDVIKKKIMGKNFLGNSSKSVFTKIYKKNLWGGESRSGKGSSILVTENIRKKLPDLLKKYRISSLLDIPCGDFFWLKEVNLDFLFYTGADVVNEIIVENNKKYSSKKKLFLKLDILKDPLPAVDLILCRDLLVHFTLKDIIIALENMKRSNSKYLLTTSFVSKKTNNDIKTGQWRPLNLLVPPFSFPKPLLIVDENWIQEDEIYSDKSLILWKISDLNL